MSILEILWILATVALLLITIKLALEEIGAFICTGIVTAWSICMMIAYWIDILTKPLW